MSFRELLSRRGPKHFRPADPWHLRLEGIRGKKRGLSKLIGSAKSLFNFLETTKPSFQIMHRPNSRFF